MDALKNVSNHRIEEKPRFCPCFELYAQRSTTYANRTYRRPCGYLAMEDDGFCMGPSMIDCIVFVASSRFGCAGFVGRI